MAPSSSSTSFTFHPYEHTPSPSMQHADETLALSPGASSKRSNRLNTTAPFPTFLYASEPPPMTARNKQRVRPTPEQLKALKELYVVSAHPSREVRESLGQRIGMRYQSVTNWFQNQRSTAKRKVNSSSSTNVDHHTDVDDDEHSTHSSFSHNRRDSISSTHTTPSTRAHSPTPSMYSSDEQHHVPVAPPAPAPPRRRDPVKDIIVAQAAARQQLHELALPLSGAAIVSSCPQSTASASTSASTSTSPTSTHRPDLVGTPATMLNLSLPATSRATTPALLSSFQVSRASSPHGHHHALPQHPHAYQHPTLPPMHTHGQTSPHAHALMADEGVMVEHIPPRAGKRSRPTPKQLAALRALHAITESPTIEERIQLGNEIGMELGKVTNWFRNLRQTARKKERKALEAEGKTLPPPKRSRPSLSEESSMPPSKRARLSPSPSQSHYDHDENEHDADIDTSYDAHSTAHFSRPASPAPHHLAPTPPHRPSLTDSETETGSAHEAVTPPPPAVLHDVTAPATGKGTEKMAQGGEPKEDVRVDEALLLLAFHDAA